MTFWILILSFVVFDVLWWRWADGRLRRVAHTRGWRTVLGIFMGLQMGCFALLMIARMMDLRPPIPVPMLAAMYIWHLAVLPAAMVLLGGTSILAGVSRLIRRLVQSLRSSAQNSPAAPTISMVGPSRRDLLLATATAVPPLLAMGSAGYGLHQIRGFRVNRMELPLRGLPSSLEGLSIAHISDIHIGKFTPEHKLAAIVRETNALKPDLVLMTGDLIDFSLHDLPTGIELLRALRPRVGMYIVEGNHDLIEDREAFEQRMLDARMPMLLNQSTTIDIGRAPAQILGLRWGRYGRRDEQIGRDMNDLLTRRRTEAFPILLAHHPHAFDSAVAAGIPLTLSGHTHGGQLMLTRNIGPGPLMFRYWSGLYQRNNCSMMVSNGVGNWFPLRINAPAEIVHITLREA